MRKRITLTIILLVVYFGAAYSQAAGTYLAYSFLKDEFFQMFNKWSEAAQKNPSGVEAIQAESELKEVLAVKNVRSNPKIKDEIFKANKRGSGWYGFFEYMVNHRVPFVCTFDTAFFETKDVNDSKKLWFLVKYKVEYWDPNNWESGYKYCDTTADKFTKKVIDVSDYMLVQNLTYASSSVELIDVKKPKMSKSSDSGNDAEPVTVAVIDTTRVEVAPEEIMQEVPDPVAEPTGNLPMHKLQYGRWYGEVDSQGLPHGDGRMEYTSDHQLSKYDRKGRIAHAGDRVDDASYQHGEMVEGDFNGEYIYIGGR